MRTTPVVKRSFCIRTIRWCFSEPSFPLHCRRCLSFPQAKLIRRWHAWRRRTAVACVQLVSPEQRVPTDHPLRPLRAMADEALRELHRVSTICTPRPDGPRAPERLLRALLLQVLYSVRSERMLMEQLDYNLLFRWFVGLNMDDAIWDATVFTKNRQRLLDGDIADAFFAAVLKQARQRNLLSDEHFTVDGTLLEVWAGQKSFRHVDDNHRPPATGEGSNPTVNFHGESRSNETHCSTTDPDAMLARKSRGTGAVLAYRGHLLTENRNGQLTTWCEYVT